MTNEIFIWEGIYSSFREAEAESCGPGFSGDTYIKRTMAAASECLNALSSGAPIPQFHKQRSNLLPPVAAMMLKDSKPLRILDFGGGLGIGYMTLAESIPGLADKISYTIVELPEVCEAGQEICSGRFEYLDTLPSLLEFDLVHSASALQYVKDWKALLKGLTSSRPEYILLSDVFAGNIQTFLTLQNYYSSKIPHWFINLDEFTSCMWSCGYCLEMKSYVNSKRLGIEDFLPMENFPESHRLSQTLHLLFRKRKDS